MGSSNCRQDERPKQNIIYNIIINNWVISYTSKNIYPIQNDQPIVVQGGRNRASDCRCTIYGEEFLKGRFFNNGENIDNFNCRQCDRSISK